MTNAEGRGLLRLLYQLKRIEIEYVEGAETEDLLNQLISNLEHTCTHGYNDRMTLTNEAIGKIRWK